jgi:hypothetical protein
MSIGHIPSFTPQQLINTAKDRQEMLKLHRSIGGCPCARCYECLHGHMQEEVCVLGADPVLGEDEVFVLKKYLTSNDLSRVLPIDLEQVKKMAEQDLLSRRVA